MIELASIFQIPLCIILVKDMDKAESPSYSSSNNEYEYVVDEQITQGDLPPGVSMKISKVPFDSATWHTTLKQIQVLHLVRYFKLYTYV